MANEIRNASQYFGQDSLPIRVLTETMDGKPDRHSHTFFELVLARSGFGYHISNNQAEFMVPGSVAAVAPGMVHTFMGAKGLELVTCVFTPELVLTLDRDMRELPPLRKLFRPGGVLSLAPLSNSQRAKALSLLERMSHEAAERKPAWEGATRNMLTLLLIHLARCQGKAGSVQGVEALMPHIGKTVAYIHENYMKNIDSDDMSAHAGLSYDYLIRVFKKAMGMSPAEYLRNYRIGKALTLLQRTDMLISDIAAEVGVSDVSVFARQFRKINGITPSDARKGRTGFHFDADY